MKTLVTAVSLLFFCLLQDPVHAQPDTTRVPAGDSSHTLMSAPGHITIDSLLRGNAYLNLKEPVSLVSSPRSRTGKEFMFYLLAATTLLAAIFKVFYVKYFNNIFRVFFNTSLRQNQLTDLLLQAKLPSLIFNIFFVISSGLYAWLLLSYYQRLKEGNQYTFLALAVLFVALVYCGKYISLKLFGWMSGTSLLTDRYIFVIFLINKIAGVILLPFIILLAFSPAAWMNTVIILSLTLLGILFLLRYLRTWGLLRSETRINPFHFLLYIAGMEILPILILYKLVFRVLL